MPLYLYQFKNQPKFRWDRDKLAHSLGSLRFRQGRLIGQMEMQSPSVRADTVAQVLALDVSPVSGSRLPVSTSGLQVAASGSDPNALTILFQDAAQGAKEILSENRLWGWYRRLSLPLQSPASASPLSGSHQAGTSFHTNGPGAARIHYTSPHTPVPTAELRKFITWFNTERETDPVLKAAIAHLWFLVISPFNSGNEQIAHALTVMQLAHADTHTQRFYSISVEIRREQEKFDMIHKRVRGARERSTESDITDWIECFLSCMDRALTAAEHRFSTILNRTRFIQKHALVSFNDRQQFMIHKLLDGLDTPDDLDPDRSGKSANRRLSSSQWARIAGCSQDTALRDIQELVDRGLMVKEAAGGRSTNYVLAGLQTAFA